jgi:hypothetical protein
MTLQGQGRNNREQRGWIQQGCEELRMKNQRLWLLEELQRSAMP